MPALSDGFPKIVAAAASLARAPPVGGKSNGLVLTSGRQNITDASIATDLASTPIHHLDQRHHQRLDAPAQLQRVGKFEHSKLLRLASMWIFVSP